MNGRHGSLRVLQVIPSVSLVHGGPSRAVRLIGQALRGQGVATEIATTDDEGPGQRTECPLGVAIEADGETCRYFRKNTDSYKVSMPLARWLFAHARDYDLIHIHALFSFSSTAAALAARWARVPYVVRPLGTLADYGMTHRRPWLKRLSMALIEGPILRHAAAVHFTSEMERNEAMALGIGLRAAVVPLAVEPAPAEDLEGLLSAFPALRGKRWVLYLSRLDPKKNVEGLLHAVALCAAEFPGLRWLIAGDGDPDYAAELRALAQRLGIEDRIVWPGSVQGGLKAAALAHAECFVLPSHSENFGIAAAEALQAGLPVVLGKGVALAGLAAESGAGLAVEPTADAIANAMRGYLLNPNARARAGINARSLASREFSPGTMGARLARLYETILTAPDRKWPVALGDH